MNYKLLLFCFSILAVGKAQQYYPLPTQYGLWYNQQLADFFQPQPIFYTYTLSGDTTINTIAYKKLYNNGYIGALREEDKQVYYWPADSVSEYILYNFNAHVGDTIFNPYSTHCAATDIDTIIVQAIDSVVCDDGNYHKRFLLQNPAAPGFGEYIIEGIGSLHGIVSPWYDVYYQNGGQRLNCAASGNGPLYHLPGADCVTTLQEPAAIHIEIYPNPVTNYFTLKSPQVISTIRVCNAVGNCVYSKLINAQQATVELTIPAGLYIVTAETGNRVVKKTLIVVK